MKATDTTGLQHPLAGFFALQALDQRMQYAQSEGALLLSLPYCGWLARARGMLCGHLR